MKSPAELAKAWAQQWGKADWRERQLLGADAAWPLTLSIGQPGPQVFTDASGRLLDHLQQWRQVEQLGLGQVRWQQRRYRGGSEAVHIPTHWQLSLPSQYIAAISHFKAPGHAQIKAEYARLSRLIGAVERPGIQRLLVRRLTQWAKISPEEIMMAVQLALRLEPGCAQGKPLRALALAGNDSKFFERHSSLLTLLLDERFEGEASRQGLCDFLGALPEGDHWLLVVPLAPGLLPFARLRVTAAELQHTALPAQRILLVENERSLHQLPRLLPDTIAVLGSGLDLQWLSADWLQRKAVAYWGDLDTWGFAMLSTARRHLPRLQALLMDQNTWELAQASATEEPVKADTTQWAQLLPAELALVQSLADKTLGRLEQEFLPLAHVQRVMGAWAETPEKAS